MTRKIFIASGIFVIFISLYLNAISYAVVDDTAKQPIYTSMDGFAFTNDGCCPKVSTNLNGEATIDSDDTMELLQQSGTIIIGSTIYSLEFTPTDKTTKEIVNNDCSSSITYQQDGEINMVGSDGTVIKGSGEYSWGTYPSCSDEKHSFTNFSGKVQDASGQSIEFFTGTDLLPII